MWAGTRVLVTGASGFLGRHLVDALEARGAAVLVTTATTGEGVDELVEAIDADR